MTYPVGQNNQIYYRGELQDKIKEANIKERAPKAGVADTAMKAAAAEPMVSLKNVAVGTASVAALDFLMSLGIKGGENSLLVKLINKIEKSKWAQNQRTDKALLRQAKRKAWIKNLGDKLLGSSKSAFLKGRSSKSIGMKMPAAHTHLDIENAKAIKEKGKGLEGSLKTQRDLIKRLDKVKEYKDVVINGKIQRVAIKESTALSRGIARFFVGVKHFIGNAVGGSSGGMNVLKKMGGGSLFGYLMNGVFIGMSIQEAKHAPKGERKKAFMEDFIGNWIFGFACWPMITRFVNGLTGFGQTQKMAKNYIKGDAALTKSATKLNFLDQIIKTGKYNANAELFLEKIKNESGVLVKNPKYDDVLKKELDAIVSQANPQRAAKKASKPLRKALYKKLPLQHKLLNRFGRFVSMGRSHTWSNVKNAQGLRKTGKFLNFAFKRIPGGLFRMIALVGVLTLPFAFVGKKISHLCFGKPNRPEEGKNEPTQMSNYDKAKVEARIQDLLAGKGIQSKSENNFNKAIKAQAYNSPTPVGPISKTTVEKKELKEPKYIPSTAPVIVDNSAINQETAELLNKSERYERYSSDFLKDI